MKMKYLKAWWDQCVIKKIRIALMLQSTEAMDLKVHQLAWEKVRFFKMLKIITTLSLLGIVLQQGARALIKNISDSPIWITAVVVVLLMCVLVVCYQFHQTYQRELNRPGWGMAPDPLSNKPFIFIGAIPGTLWWTLFQGSSIWEVCGQMVWVNAMWFGVLGWYGWQCSREGYQYGKSKSLRQKEMRRLVSQKGSVLYEEYHPKAVALFEKRIFDRIAKKSLKEKRSEMDQETQISSEIKGGVPIDASLIKVKTVRRL